MLAVLRRSTSLPSSTMEPLLPASRRDDLFEIVVDDGGAPRSLSDLRGAGAAVVEEKSLSGRFADIRLVVPSAPFHGDDWRDVGAWTAFPISQALLCQASPVFRRIMENRLDRHDRSDVLVQWTPSVNATSARVLLNTLCTGRFAVALDSAVELRALLQFWWAPADSNEADEFLPHWNHAMQVCVELVDASLHDGGAGTLYERAIRCADEETETAVVGLVSQQQNLPGWLNQLDGSTLYRFLDHSACRLPMQRKLRVLLEWAATAQSHPRNERVDADLRTLVQWDTLTSSDARAIGLESIVRAVDVGLLDAPAAFRVLRHLRDVDGQAAAPAAPPPRAMPAPAVLVPPVVRAMPARAFFPLPAPPPLPAAWRRWSERSAFVLANTAANAVSASGAVVGGAIIVTSFGKDWSLLHQVPAACWVGGLWGLAEGIVGQLVLTSNGRIPTTARYRSLAWRQVTTGVGLGAAFVAGASAGNLLERLIDWPFNHGASNTLQAVATVTGATIGAVAGSVLKMYGVGVSCDL